MQESSMKKQITLVAALEIAFSVIGLLSAAALYMIMSFAQSFIPDSDLGYAVLGFIKNFMPPILAICSLLTLIGGLGLLQYKSWSRSLVMVMAALGCIVVPVGTIIGVYSMWVLMQEDSKKLLA
jgi:hypothetical protein